MNVSKEKKAIVAGMVGCLLYVIGDFLFAATGKSQSTESIGLMVKVAYLDMATWRMVVSIICIVFTGIVGNLFTLLPWPLDQIDHGTESAGHLLVLVLGLVLLREMTKSGELKEVEIKR